jgi:hypothetical protein
MSFLRGICHAVSLERNSRPPLAFSCEWIDEKSEDAVAKSFWDGLFNREGAEAALWGRVGWMTHQTRMR